MTMVNKSFYVLGILLLVVFITFKDNITSNDIFSTPDSQSAAAVGKGMELHKTEFGVYPKWNPWIFSGLPSTHSLQHVSRYYPPYHIFKALNNLGMPVFYNFLFHLVFMSLGVFLILNRIKVNFWASLYSSILFLVMPYIITMIVHGHGSQMMTAAYIPWIFLFLEKIKNRQNIFNISIFTLLISFQLLRGHIQIAYYTWLLIGSYILFIFINDYRSKRIVENKIFYFAIFLSLLVGFTSSLQLFYPAYSYSPYSIRGGTDGGAGFDYATAWSFSISEMFTFLNPNYYGFGGATYWGNMPFTDYPNYMSILSIVLLFYSIIFIKNNITKFLAFIWIGSLLLSFGHNTFIYKFFYNYFPFFNKFRVPSMFLILLQFSTVLLSGLGLNYIFKQNKINSKTWLYPFVITGILLILSKIMGSFLLSSSGKTNKILDPYRIKLMDEGFYTSLSILCILFVILFLYKKNILKQSVLGLSLLFILFLDIFHVNKKIIKPNDRFNKIQISMPIEKFNRLHEDDEIIKYLKSDASNFRIFPLPPLLNSNKWSAFRIQNIGGYHPAKLQNYQSYMEKVGFNSLGYLQMLNVKYLISLEEINHPYFENVFSGILNDKGERKKAYIYLNKININSIYFPKYIESFKQKSELIDKIKSPYFDPNNIAYIQDLNKKIKNGTGEILEYSFNADKIMTKINMNESGFVIFSEIYYPNGWKCKINNSYSEIKEANGLLRAIWLEKGINNVELEFDPTDLKISNTISNIAFLIIFMGIIIGLIKYKK
jgi:hypothetical protein